MSLRYGKDFVDLKSRDEEGRDYLLRMLGERSRRSFCGEQLSRKIRLLVSHGADIGVTDKYGMSCLHALFSNQRVHHYPELLMDPLCLLVELGADIYAVTNSGYSVTEWAHYVRDGYFWEEGLEKAGYDVEQVYLEDCNRGWSFSDDVLAPKEGHPRQRGCCSSAYYNIDDFERRHRRLSIRKPNRHKFNEPEGNISDKEEEQGEEQDSVTDRERSAQSPVHEFIEEGALESDSDEEMGGVPVTN